MSVLSAMQARLRTLENAVRGLNRTTIVGFARRASSGGVTFAPDLDAPDPLYVPDKTVVIVHTPKTGDATLLVREVGYDALPPKPCESAGADRVCHYRWFYPDFEAYPPLGSEAVDFAGDVFPDVPDDAHPPKLTTVFHRVHREHEVWMIEDTSAKGGGGIRAAIVLSAVMGAHTIHVQPVKRSGFTWVADGAAIDVPLWGTQLGEDFETLIGSPGASATDVIPLIQIGGEWYAMQYLWMYSGTPNPAIPWGDCLV